MLERKYLAFYLGDDPNVGALDAERLVDGGGELAVTHAQDPALLTSLQANNPLLTYTHEQQTHI